MVSVIYLHAVCAFLSLFLLIIRAAMQLNQKDWRAIKLLKIAPHLVDTLLVVSGLVLLFGFIQGVPVWIMAKFALLVVYIIFSAKFFSRKTQFHSTAHLLIASSAFIAALLFGYFH
ncbi:SirB2 family protein [Pasteurellaceae bacterium LIM206]|nr:SirB2 family protein [Pasteurellaceae bacterium LIM206]